MEAFLASQAPSFQFPTLWEEEKPENRGISVLVFSGVGVSLRVSETHFSVCGRDGQKNGLESKTKLHFWQNEDGCQSPGMPRRGGANQQPLPRAGGASPLQRHPAQQSGNWKGCWGDFFQEVTQ